MVTFKISLLVVFLTCAAMVNAQQMPMTLGYVKMAFLNPAKSAFYLPKHTYFFGRAIDSSQVKFAPKGISSTYYTDHLGVMCKEELKLEKAIKFPVRIRLGSKEQVDYLEGKFNRH